MKKVRIVLIALFLALTAATVQAQQEGIRVNGVGTAHGAPDTALVSIGVDALDEAVAAATSTVSSTVERLTAALEDAGVDATDIRTSSFNVHREDWHTDEDGSPAEARYRVSSTLQLTVRDLTALGTLLSTAIEAGATQVHGLQFTVSDDQQLQSQARQLALEDARQRAEELAGLAGLSLGRVLYIEETGAVGFPLTSQSYAMSAMDAAAVPIEPGELSADVQLSVLFEITD